MRTTHDITNVPRKNDIYYPKSLDELQLLIQYAREKKLCVRTLGSSHSPAPSIYSESLQQLKIILDGDFRKIHSFTENKAKDSAITRVGAGCYLGVNPQDKESKLENSFNYQIDQKGYALPTLGGISHQTIAGFLQTSSSGGSGKHNIADVILEIEWINGKGDICHAKKGEALFNAVGVSMGLLGVITSVTFKLPPKYLVAGTEMNYEKKDSYLAPDAKGSYKTLDHALFENENNEYIHLNWFPQKYVQRVTHWRAKAVPATQKIAPYHHPLESKIMSVLAAGVFLIGNELATIGTELAQRLLGLLIKPFVLLGDSQTFCDAWYKALPIDDQAPVDYLMSISFSELWYPRSQIDTVMQQLELLVAENPEAAGNFMIELYCAKQSPFMLSPSEGHDAFRIDLYWYDYNLKGDANHYFGLFWAKLLEISGARLHWGKYLPRPGEQYGDLIYDPKLLQKNYPLLSKFMQYREEMDPAQIFVTPYWRQVFSIEKNERKVSQTVFFANQMKENIEEKVIQNQARL